MFNLAELWGLRPDGSNPRRHHQEVPRGEARALPQPGRTRRSGRGSLSGRARGRGGSVRDRRHPPSDLHGVPAQRDHDAEVELCRFRSSVPAAPRHQDRRQDRPSRCPSARCALQDRAAPRQSLGHLREEAWRAENRPAAALATLPQAGNGAALGPARQSPPQTLLVTRLECQLGREPTHNECLAAAEKQELELPIGLADVRIHDLRHSFASGAVALGESLPMIGKLLGHTQVQTTARYAHLAADPVKAAAERVSSNIAALINGQTGEVVRLLPRTG